MFGKYGSVFKRDMDGNSGLGEMFRGAVEGAREFVKDYTGAMDEFAADGVTGKCLTGFMAVYSPLVVPGLAVLHAASDAGYALRVHHNRLQDQGLRP